MAKKTTTGNDKRITNPMPSVTESVNKAATCGITKPVKLAPQFNFTSIDLASDTLERVRSLLICFDAQAAPVKGGVNGTINSANITPAYQAAIDGELAVLRHQLYKTGLFKTIECVKLVEV